MNTYFKLYLLAVFPFVVCCSDPSLEVVESQPKQSPIDLLNEEFNKVVASFSDTILLSFYSANNNKLLWLDDSLLLNSKAIELLGFIDSSKAYGLNSESYFMPGEIASLAPMSKDTFLSSKLMDVASDLMWGDFNLENKRNPFARPTQNKADFFANISGQINKRSVADLLESCQPNHPQYLSIISALKQFIKRTGISKNRVKVPSHKQDSANHMKLAAKALLIHGFIDSSSVDGSVLKEAIKKFQFEHGLNQDGVVGSKTSKLLSRSPFDYYLMAVLSLDRWRQKASWAGHRIEINIPEYRLRYYEDGQEVRTHKVIVGNIKAQTIEILDSVEYLVIYPYWYVPRSIINHEMLPKARKDSTYFSRKGFELLSGRTVVNSDKIDYNKSFRYTVRQKGGSSNALGLVKFIFPNPSSIYLHDTPSKRLFNKEVRAFSHGCIRLKDPLDLAYQVLENDGSSYSGKRVKELISNKERTRINLNNKFPIFIHYTLVSARDSSIVFNEDVYSREKKLIKRLSKEFK